MGERDEFLRSQKILRLATVAKDGVPHIAPVWYLYSAKKFYVGTIRATKKVRNIMENDVVSFCVDAGTKAPGIYGVMGQGRARLILEKPRIRRIARRILSRYFNDMDDRLVRGILDDGDCAIEIVPEKITVWKY